MRRLQHRAKVLELRRMGMKENKLRLARPDACCVKGAPDQVPRQQTGEAAPVPVRDRCDCDGVQWRTETETDRRRWQG